MLKNLKNWDTENNYCYGPKIEKFSFFSAVKQLKDAMIKVNSIDPDLEQSVPSMPSLL